MAGKLNNKVALISGGATGMGGAASRLFAAEGAAVGIVDINAKAGVEALGRGLRTELTAVGASSTVAYYGWIDTDLVTGAFEDPLVQRIREDVTPAWMTRKVPTSKAGKVVIDALEKREPRAIAPAEWKALFYGRGVLGPVFDRMVDEDQAIAQIVPEAESRQKT